MARSANDDIAKAVAVDISGPRDGVAGQVVRTEDAKPKAVDAIEGGKIQTAIKPRGSAEYDVTFPPGFDPRPGRR
jgi:hypothetical protein